MDGQRLSDTANAVLATTGVASLGVAKFVAQTVFTGPMQDISLGITIVCGIGMLILIWRAVVAGDRYGARRAHEGEDAEGE